MGTECIYIERERERDTCMEGSKKPATRLKTEVFEATSSGVLRVTRSCLLFV